GIVSPGQSPGILSTSTLTLDAGSTYHVELNGTAPGAGYDQLAVAGLVNLGNAVLDVVFGYTPAAGDTYTIITNDMADAVTGTFAGLPNGSWFPVGSYKSQISYRSGDGNDVVLTFIGCVGDASGPTVTAPTAATVTQTICQ